MSAADAPEEPEREQRLHGEPAVHEPVVNEHVPDPEEGHPDAGAHEDGAHPAVELAPRDEEARRNRRVQERERVVLLEATGSRLVMRTVHAPQTMMPDAAVEESRPELHRCRDDGRREQADDDLDSRPAAHEAPP